VSWARGDDRYDDHPKIKKAWRVSGYAVGLHWMATTASCRHETDGLVDPEWLAEKLAVLPPKARQLAVDTVVKLGLFEALPAGETRAGTDRHGFTVTIGPVDEDTYIVHDFLEYNDSSAYLRDRRARDAARKATGGRKGLPQDSARSPSGVDADSASPYPALPDQKNPPNPPRGEWAGPPTKPAKHRSTDLAAWEEQMDAYAAWLVPDIDEIGRTELVRVAIGFAERGGGATNDRVRATVRQLHGDKAAA
jgi:hypothetical protein